MDNGKADHSIIDNDLMSKHPGRRHHYQERRDMQNNYNSIYSKQGYYLLLQGNKKFNKNQKTNEIIWGSMWKFAN